LLEGLEAEQERIEKRLAELSYPKEEVRLLMTLPGVGAAAAQAWSSPEKVDTASAAGLMVSLDGDFGFENEY
jgi:hypothetical protein